MYIILYPGVLPVTRWLFCTCGLVVPCTASIAVKLGCPKQKQSYSTNISGKKGINMTQNEVVKINKKELGSGTKKNINSV